MKSGSKLIALTAVLLLCQCLIEVECRRTFGGSSSRRNSGRNNYGNQSQNSKSRHGSFFSSFFESSNKKASSSGSGSGSASGKKSSSGWMTGSQASKMPSQQSGGWANPYYKPSAPKQPSYGWTATNKKPETGVGSNQFQKSSQPSSNIGPGGYPVQSGLPQPNTAGHYPQSSAFNTAQKPYGYNPSQGFNAGQQQHGYNPYQQSHGFNAAPQPQGYNTGHHPPPSYGQPSYQAPPSYHGSNTGGYHPGSNFGSQGYASNHGISPSYYPAQNSFGYPGQGLLGGSHGPKYGGLGIFGGGTGNFGYSGGSSWGYPSYASKASSGKGKLLTGLALGAAGGYLTSSLVNKISNPWGYSGYGYGNRFGYDRPIIIREIKETTKTETPSQAADPSDNWIHCVAFDPSTNTTLINPNCSCTVTTVVDPMTNQPISTHNCTTANGQVLPPHPVGAPLAPPVEPMPVNAVNNPNASPTYGGLYQDNQRYGSVPEIAAAPPAPSATTEQTSSSTAHSDASTTEGMLNDSPPAKEGDYQQRSTVKQFYNQLEQIVNMGKFH